MDMRRTLHTLRKHPYLAARLIALTERLSRLMGRDPELWPKPPPGLHLSPSEAYFYEYERAPLRLSWSHAGTSDPVAWQNTVRAKLADLIGFQKPVASPTVVHETNEDLPNGLRRHAFYIERRPYRHIPVNIVWSPDQTGSGLPIMLCLQGHTSGAHISWGEARATIDPYRIARDSDYAVQAVRQGFVAVCIEQTAFGERREHKIKLRWEHTCIDAANHSLLLGRTLLAERIMDVCSVINWLHAYGIDLPLDLSRLYMMGNSAGGETSLYSTALDERIAGVIASGCVGRFTTTSGTRKTCPDTVVPGVLNWFEYDDIIALCAPRPVLAVSGVKDHIYPFAEVKRAIEGASAVYRAFDALENIKAVQGPDGHRFYGDITWPVFLEMIRKRLPHQPPPGTQAAPT